MSPDALRLAAWLAPSFPVGGFAHSGGLEAALAEGRVSDPVGAGRWIARVVLAGSGRIDAGLIVLARREGADLEALGDLARALASGPGRTRELGELGAAFTAAMAAIGRALPAGLPYPVALGAASRGLAVTDAAVVALWLSGLAQQLAAVAQRLLPMGQLAAVALVDALMPAIGRLADDMACVPGPEALWSAAPGADIAAMRQEDLMVRMFRS